MSKLERAMTDGTGKPEFTVWDLCGEDDIHPVTAERDRKLASDLVDVLLDRKPVSG